MADALQGICNRNVFGSCVLSLSYGFQDENDGDGFWHVRTFNFVSDRVVLSIEDHNNWEAGWSLHVNQILPCSCQLNPHVCT
jgi:hypothetical protein